MAPPLPPSLDLPKPPADLKAVRKGDGVLLTWTIPTVTTDRQTIRSFGPTRICRATGDLTHCASPVAEIESQAGAAKPKSSKRKPAATYTDNLPVSLQSDAPDASVAYAVEVLNRDGRGAGISNSVRVSAIRTPPPVDDLRAKATGNGIVLSWSSAASAGSPKPQIRYVYRIYRRHEGSEESMLISEVPANPAPQPSFTDSNFDWEKTYYYSVETVAMISEPGKPETPVEGNSTEVKIFADDVFPPAVPASLQAVFSGPGQQPFVDLVWAPVTDADLAGYNVYRREDSGPLIKLNAELVKPPAYRDAKVAAGKHYSYSVSAVDLRGNESARSEETAESVPQ